MTELALRIVELRDLAGQQAAVDLFCDIWRASPADVVAVGTVRALAYAGNYVSGAYRGEVLVGASVGFLGADHLHSHITGVMPGLWGTGVGYALKQHQRNWALQRGIEAVHWTFDPLVRRNAYFNLHKLGATARAYLPDFYGPMNDGVNAGDASDRLYLTWELTSPRAVAAAEGRFADAPTEGVAAVLDRVGGAPEQVVHSGGPVLVAVPHDIEALRKEDATLAGRWRHAVREALTGALDDGYRITGISRQGYYLLEQP